MHVYSNSLCHVTCPQSIKSLTDRVTKRNVNVDQIKHATFPNAYLSNVSLFRLPVPDRKFKPWAAGPLTSLYKYSYDRIHSNDETYVVTMMTT